MIYTITLNPSLDYVMIAPKLELGTTNRSEQELFHIGGKGINVSIVLNNLQVETHVLGFVGGFSGDHFKELLKEYPYVTDSLISYSGTTRINIKIKGQVETEINGRGSHVPVMSQQQLQLYIDQFDQNDIVVLSGSIAAGMDTQWYVDTAKYLAAKKIPYILDIATQKVMDILPYKPFLIKPNEAELASIFNQDVLTEGDILAKGAALVSEGAQHVIVSRGAKGSLLFTKTGIYRATVPSGKLIDSVGAGDSMVAGFLYGYLLSKDTVAAFKYASSCGTATAYSEHLAEEAKIREILISTKIEQIHSY